MKVATRFPPSPTGYFHIGGARTALFNYLFAAHHGGTMYLRFEDTDKKRNKKEFEDDIVEGLEWLKIPYTLAEPPRQSERTELYKKALSELCASGKAYISKEPSKENPEVEVEVVRLKNPGAKVVFDDLTRGEVSFDTAELKDFVIARNMEEALYHFTVVVDDFDMKITHVIRGEDHISNTARQILILEALGYERPQYAHIPLILAPDKSKLSKRHGAVSVNEYRTQGYVPEAIVNYLALLGWNPGGEQELFSLGELVQKFSLEHVHKSGAIFDTEKLRWFNREHLQKLSDAEFLKEVATRVPAWKKETLEKLAPIVRERLSIWGDLKTLQDEFDFFFVQPKLDVKKLPGKGGDAASAKKHLSEVRKCLGALPSSGSVDPEHVKSLVWDYAEKEGRGAVLWPLRYALTGREKSPDPFVVASVIGREAVLERLDAALKTL